MLNQLEDCYQLVAELMFERIPEPWTEAWIDAELDSGWGQFTGDYVATSGETKWFDPGGMYKEHGLLDIFTAMSAFMKHPEHEAWNKCRFHLTSEGDFKLDVSYVDPSELGQPPL